MLICRPCRREQEINAHGHSAGRDDDAVIVHPNREQWPIPVEQQFVERIHTVNS